MSKRLLIIALGVLLGFGLAVGCYIAADAMANLAVDHPTFAASPTKRRDSIGSGLFLLCIPVAFVASVWISVRLSRQIE